jgi:hypothetical protein
MTSAEIPYCASRFAYRRRATREVPTLAKWAARQAKSTSMSARMLSTGVFRSRKATDRLVTLIQARGRWSAAMSETAVDESVPSMSAGQSWRDDFLAQAGPDGRVPPISTAQVTRSAI